MYSDTIKYEKISIFLVCLLTMFLAKEQMISRSAFSSVFEYG